jgi:hypothetical protein
VAAAGTATLAPWPAQLYSERIPVSDAPASSAHFAATKPLMGWLKEHRRIATRFEKLAGSFLAMVELSFVRRYFRMLERFSGST